MTLFRSLSPPSSPAYETERCSVRAPEDADYFSWSQLRSISHDFLQPFEPRWPLDELTRPSFRRRLRRYSQDARDKVGYALFIFDRLEGHLMGGMTLSNIRYGVSQSCSLGYWMGEPFAGNGYMSEAMDGIFPFLFDELGLHRIEAACLPDNRASIELLKSKGFAEEGLAKSYLKINGRWQDHRLFAKIAPF